MVDRDNGPLNYTEMQRSYASKRFNEIAELIPEYDMVALLDRSARPLFLGLHDLIQRKGYVQPHWRFMNFGSEKTQWVFKNGASHLNFFLSPMNKDKIEDILTKDNVASFISPGEINYLISLLQLDQPLKRLFVDEISISGATHYTLLRLLD